MYAVIHRVKENLKNCLLGGENHISSDGLSRRCSLDSIIGRKELQPTVVSVPLCIRWKFQGKASDWLLARGEWDILHWEDTVTRTVRMTLQSNYTLIHTVSACLLSPSMCQALFSVLDRSSEQNRDPILMEPTFWYGGWGLTQNKFSSLTSFPQWWNRKSSEEVVPLSLSSIFIIL